MPIGAFLAKEHASVLEPGDHGSTFGGNVLTCAAAYASSKYIVDNDVPSQAGAAGEYLKERLVELKSRYPYIAEVRGMGLLLGLAFHDEVSAKVVRCLQRRRTFAQCGTTRHYTLHAAADGE